MAQRMEVSRVVDLDADSFSDSELLSAAPPPSQSVLRLQPATQPRIAIALATRRSSGVLGGPRRS